jgi:REP element-mobilizing transposase RayT
MSKQDQPQFQQTIFETDQPATRDSEPMTCLGMTFPNDEERRKHFLGILREKLKDPEFRKIEGFPIGSDEDILALSDPPYYTACPNPFIAEFIKHYGKPYDPTTDRYRREPFAVDVSEGKTNPLYKAHGYHTKVPHLAIVPSILHYTRPGDIVLDGFAGSGMTAVAAQWCGSAPAAYRFELEQEWQKAGIGKPEWGARRAIAGDLSPVASFIAAGYNLPFDVAAFEQAARLLAEVEREIGWMYQTLHVEPASSRLFDLIGFPRSRQDLGSTQIKTTDDLAGITKFTQRRGDLPHWQLPGSFYFLTFNTHQRRELSPESRQVMLDALSYFDGQRLRLTAAVVMPDHVHAVIQPREKSAGLYWDLADLMHSVKSYSANRVNQIEKTAGTPVWQTETYDRIIRDERELRFTLQYIASNPVVAGLANDALDYSWFKIGDKVKEAGWKPAPLRKIEYTVWSEVFSCPECVGELVFLEEALDADTKRVREAFPCPHCGVKLTKKRLDWFYELRYDAVTGQSRRVSRRRPVLIRYRVGSQVFEKQPDADDLALLQRIEQMPLPLEVPTDPLPYMHMTHERARMDLAGITHIHHFFLPRQAQALGLLWRKAHAEADASLRRMLLFFVEQAIWGMSVLARYAPTPLLASQSVSDWCLLRCVPNC